MRTNTIIKALAFAMLLVSACNKSEIANDENTEKKGFALPVTVNVTREGDDATKATYTDNGDGTGSLGFSAGDKLFVSGSATGAGSFAGALDYDAVSGKFSGTIYTKNDYDGTADALFSAASSVRANLLPAGYESYNFLYINNKSTDVLYDDVVAATVSKAFVASETAKKTGVEQLSWEQAYTYSSGFALAPANAVLNFTISGLEAGEKAVTLITKYSGMDFDQTMSGSVTPNASGVATFAIGVPNNLVIKNVANNLTVGSSKFTLPGGTALAAGKIYNITRNAISGALIGQFSVSSTKKVYFSKGNLQYTKNTGIWSFMDHQYSTVETTSQAIGDDYASQDVVSLFGWGTSGWNNDNTYYQPYNTAYVNSSSKGYGYGPKNGTTYTYDLTGTYANADWGHNAISNGGNTAGTWRTLTKDEWTYLFNTRSASTVNGTENARYAKAYLFGTTHGVIIFPDSYTHPAGVAAPLGINETSYTSWDGNQYTATDWAKMEAAGCVFLPAAGWRDATTIKKVNEYVRYWTSTTYSIAGYAHNVGITESSMTPADYNQKNYGYSVRLVHDAN